MACSDACPGLIDPQITCTAARATLLGRMDFEHDGPASVHAMKSRVHTSSFRVQASMPRVESTSAGENSSLVD